MAVRGDIDADLTLEISGHAVTPDKFLRSVRSFFAILTEVSKTVSDKPVDWLVQVKKGSNLVGVMPRPGFDQAAVAVITDAVARGIAQVEGEASVPDFFNERALKSLRDLGRVTGASDHDDTVVNVWVRKEPVKVTQKAVAHVSDLLATEHEDHGSIEGRLQTVTERGRLQFIVYDSLWDRPIRCLIPEHLMKQAFDAFGQRVEVYGLVKYRKDGRPVSIDVEDIVAFPPRETIPSYRDVHGILRHQS